MQDKISQDWKEALKARDPKKDVLSLMKTELKNKAIDSRSGGEHATVVSDDDALDVLTKMAKQRRESIESFKAGGREDLAQKEQFELSIIESYLPTQMTEDEILSLVKKVVSDAGATSMKDMGKVMGAAISASKGRAPGNLVQAAVKKVLGG